MGRTSKLDAATQQIVVERVLSGDSNPSAWVSTEFGVTVRTATNWLQQLVKQSRIIATGTTRKRYSVGPVVDQVFAEKLEGLSEDRLWRQRVEPFFRSIPENVKRICHYGFTEMVNNAIDHSKGTQVAVKVMITAETLTFYIADDGVGAFKKIQESLGLASASESILELAKGKFTSDPKNHTGQGIFFTSRMFDVFFLKANGLRFIHHSVGEIAHLYEALESSSGTTVLMEIDRNTHRTTNDIFYRFAPPDALAFDRTEIAMTKAIIGDEQLVSRSQAKRLVFGLEKFKIVTLDFAGIDEIGQAFADEVFRVFRNAHPSVDIRYVNASPFIISMINRAAMG